jgi:hypothetical protein
MSSLRTLADRLGGARLYLLPHRTDEPGNRPAPDPRWLALTGLLVALLLVLGGMFLIRKLGRAARLQVCVMSGRTDCAPIDPRSAGAPADASGSTDSAALRNK